MIDWVKEFIPDRMQTMLGDVEFSAKKIRGVLGHGKGDLKILLFPHVERMLNDGVLFNVNKDGEFTYYNIAHRLQYEGSDYVARLVVREDRMGKRYYDHEFSEIKKIDELPNGAKSPSLKGEHLTHQSTAKILQKILTAKGNGENLQAMTKTEREGVKTRVARISVSARSIAEEIGGRVVEHSRRHLTTPTGLVQCARASFFSIEDRRGY